MTHLSSKYRDRLRLGLGVQRLGISKACACNSSSQMPCVLGLTSILGNSCRWLQHSTHADQQKAVLRKSNSTRDSVQQQAERRLVLLHPDRRCLLRLFRAGWRAGRGSGERPGSGRGAGQAGRARGRLRRQLPRVDDRHAGEPRTCSRCGPSAAATSQQK